MVLVIKDPPANARGIRDVGSIPGSGRSPEAGHGNPLQCSSLENSMDREASQAIFQGGCKESDTTEVILHTCNYNRHSCIDLILRKY